MRKSELFVLLVFVSFLALPGVAHAEYWFQSGARAAGNSNSNNGASVQIQTITTQNLSIGSMAFWVGETLSNGAFLQIGYTISNQTGNLSTECTTTGCAGSTFVKAGDAEWFYEYFPPGNNSTFFGSTGPDGSAGTNGTFNTYSFYSLGNTWYFKFNNKTVGSVNVGAADSGPYAPLAIGEIANTSNAKTYMKPVIFANLSAYKYDMFLPVQTAYGTINYGVGSRKNLANPYGVQEIDSRTNYFMVGSGLSTSTNSTKLWSLGYTLAINSKYGNLSSKISYIAYTVQQLSAPSAINLTNDTRVVFTGWTGSGLGYYSGSQNNVQLLMTANITETANWQKQYWVNVNSPYSFASGAGWYANGSEVKFSIANSTFLRNGAQPFRFEKWSNGATGTANQTLVHGPLNISALWQYQSELLGVDSSGQRVNVSQYLVNGQQVNATPFLEANSTAVISGAFYKGVWIAASTDVTQDSPEAVNVPLPIYNVTLRTTGLFGLPINASVAITFKNGTQTTMYSGPDGMLTINDVPDGFANATATYFLMKGSAIVSNGVASRISILSPLNVIELLVLAGIFIYVFERNRKGLVPNQGAKQPQPAQRPRQQ
ncbi:MAG: hypothetical protein M1286_01985 [Candidatus Marsarchaeota archaeon]|nr:hypothetical protein [Candidatus Marsarchaeota archaeon]